MVDEDSQYVVGMWPVCGQYVVGKGSQYVVVCGWYVVGMWSVCGWYVVLWTRE